MEKPEKKQPVPPYLSFTTLTNFTDGLGVNMPTRIDKSLMRSMSGTAQSSLISALDYFKLRDGERPSAKLVTLAGAKGAERTALWNELVHKYYPFLFSDGFNLERATQAELDERFRAAGVSGETIKKCVSFFMAAAKAGGVALSPHFKTIKSRAPRSRGTSGAKLKRKREEHQDTTPPPPPPDAVGSTKTIQFKSGGSATLSVSVDVVNLSPTDREALFAWIDAMSDYEKSVAGTTDSREGG